MQLKRDITFCILFLFFSTIAYAQKNSNLRENAMEKALSNTQTKASSIEKTLQAIEKNQTEKDKIEKKKEIKIAEEINYPMQPEKKIFGLKSGEKYLVWGLRLGYMNGNTAYDFNHHTSELEFPMNNWMAGTNLCAGFKNLSLNIEGWLPLEDYAGLEMKDKDWISGILVSYTKSKAYMDAIIADANLRYDFFQKPFLHEGEDPLLDLEDMSSDKIKFDKVKIGLLLGYRFERFDYDLYDLFYDVDLLYGYQGQTLYPGRIVGTYKIKYHLPYFGLAAELIRKNWGIGFNLKYSFYPTAEDVDNHLLRGLTFYGDYNEKGQAWLGSIYGFWKFAKNWNLKAGADGTSVRIDGITWEEQRDPSWDAHQNTDMKHWILWSGIEYKF